MRRYDDSVNASATRTTSRSTTTYRQLGRVHTLREDYRAAAETYHEALEFSPDSTAEILTALGLLYLRMGENYRAFHYLGNSLTHDPKDAKTILAAEASSRTTTTWTWRW